MNQWSVCYKTFFFSCCSFSFFIIILQKIKSVPIANSPFIFYKFLLKFEAHSVDIAPCIAVAFRLSLSWFIKIFPFSFFNTTFYSFIYIIGKNNKTNYRRALKQEI